jgi:GntR family transcriptional repressor for pyruvate dehydrogenase complex
MLRAGAQEVPFANVQEVRRLLEVEFAGLAAERRSESDLEAMRAQLLAMGEREQDPQAWAEADVAFHAAIAVATQNPLYPLLLSSIAHMLIEVRLTGIGLPDTPRRALRHHSAIFEQIGARNAAGARRAMQEHLRESEETFRRARFARIER